MFNCQQEELAGYLSQELLDRAEELWLALGEPKPVVRVAENQSLAFTWTHEYPRKELEIWLFDRHEYYAKCLFSCGRDREGSCRSLVELLEIVKDYQQT